ncbi:MAG: NAD(P)/FAD-dependent oxidoreductase [Nitrospiraceae bacterium]|nr:NAD(P)/FAD-dependent oxidoreductase [Nitrospiraceae bacterium]
MARVVIVGASIGGLPAAYEARELLGEQHKITVISNVESFHFVPSNPWVAVGWRKRKDISFALGPVLEKKGIEFLHVAADRIEAEQNRVMTSKGEVPYDYLIIATGPRLNFGAVPGLGPSGYSQSVCNVDHAEQAWGAYQSFLKDPGPIVIGAAQGASCFGPAYEMAFILDADLRQRKLRKKVPMYFVTPEPYIGHMGLAGVGKSRRLMEDEFSEHAIKPMTGASIKEVQPGKFMLEDGQEVPFRYSMIIPPFAGVEAVASTAGLCNPKGFVNIDAYQTNPKYKNIYAVGVCVAIPPVEQTPVPTGAPKTGYMIESMVAAAVHNIKADIDNNSKRETATWNAICLADMGDTGMAFVAIPQMAPRNVTWARKGKWVHLAKIGLEKYFLMKMKRGVSEPFFEKAILKAMGITKLEASA